MDETDCICRLHSGSLQLCATETLSFLPLTRVIILTRTVCIFFFFFLLYVFKRICTSIYLPNVNQFGYKGLGPSEAPPARKKGKPKPLQMCKLGGTEEGGCKWRGGWGPERRLARTKAGRRTSECSRKKK